MKKRLILFPLVLIISIFFITACSSSEEATSNKASSNEGQISSEENNGENQIEKIKKIKEAGKIRVASFPDVPGWGTINVNGEFEGYDADIARLLGEKLGVEVEFISADGAARIPLLETDKVDVTIACFTVTEERAAKVDFTVPYASSGILPLYRKDTPIKDWDDALSKVVTTGRGTIGDTALTTQFPNTEHLRLDSIADALMALKSKKADVLIEEDSALFAMAKQNPDLAVLETERLNQAVLSMAVKQGEDEWRNYLNEFITELVDSGKAHELFKKWFGFELSIPEEYELFD